MSVPPSPPPSPTPIRLRPYVPAVGPRLQWLLWLVVALFALLSINGVYLVAITLTEWLTAQVIQNYFYQLMFLAHLGLGALLIVPFVVFGVLHIKNSHDRPNRMAVKVGYALFVVGLIIVGTGVLLTRLEGFPEIKSEVARSVLYWLHILAPLAAIWLFILHRLAGPPIRWRVGLSIGAVGLVFAGLMVAFHSQDPRQWNVVGPESGEQYFFPALARTSTGNFIPADVLDMNEYCRECHEDVHDSWLVSAHKLSSFNNPVYLFSIKETREALLARDGNVQASRFCAGCHDPVPFFSGAFDDPAFDIETHETAKSGVTCTACHAITHVNSPRGVADYTIEEPSHYPFTFSESPVLRWLNRQLIKAKPAFHKKTFLKPLHKTTEFCGTCHKVHIPEELNHYKWLRGQNHYDTFLLSGVSGHGASSFYYPEKAEESCNPCHMPLEESEDFGAKDFDESGRLTVHDHQFPSANTGVLHLLDAPDEAIDAHRDFNEGVMRIDLFGLKEGGTIDGKLTAPLEPDSPPVLEPGKRYLLETVVRTVKMGHHFTQGTTDSNEPWVEVLLKSGDRVIGRSGGRDATGDVDPWSHFLNTYILDRQGNRIERRNVPDIFVLLYNHQIPPGAADTLHYAFTVPEDITEPITAEVRLLYRKFDARLLKHMYGPDHVNDLPVMELATDRYVFPVRGVPGGDVGENPEEKVPTWQRWNDYGIGLLRKGEEGSQKGELRQAEDAFRRVEELDRPDGPLNLARVYVKEGRLDDAVDALRRAATHRTPAPPWTVAWFTGLVNKQNGHLDKAIENFLTIAQNRFQEAVDRGFDFSLDYRVLNELGQTLFERSKQERGAARQAERDRLQREAVRWFRRVLELDPENVTAHYNLALIHSRLGDEGTAAKHRALHAKYKPDDNARDRVINQHRAQNPAADHAAESVVIYDLQRPDAFRVPRPVPATDQRRTAR